MRLFWLALGWSVGLALASGPFPVPSIWIGLLVPALLALLLARRLRWPALTLVALALGGLRLSIAPATDSLSAFNDRGGLTLEGIVASPPVLTDSALQLRVAVDTVERGGERMPVSGVALVRAPVSASAEPGDRVRATGFLVAPRLMGDLDYGAYLARDGVHSILRDASAEVVAPAASGGLDVLLAQVRASLAAGIERALPPPQSGLLVAMLLGDESGIAPATADAFAVTGTAHLVAISGFNMLVVSSAVQAILLRLRMRRGLATVLSVGVIAGYTLLVGASPAVLRAALMSGLLVVGQSLRRRTFIASSLAFALIVITAVNPLALWDIGFQLSLLAALGIALLAAPFTHAADRLADRWLPVPLARPVEQFINPALGTSLAAQLTVLPLIALVFGRMSLISPLVNLLVAPAQSALLLSGAAGALLTLVPFAPPLVLAPAFVLLTYTTSVIEAFARLPLAEIQAYPGAGGIALFYGLFLAGGLLMVARPGWLDRAGRRLRSSPVAVAVALAALGVLVLTGSRLIERADSALHLWFIDLDGDPALLIQTPGGAQILVDGGSHPARLLSAIGEQLPFDDRQIDLWAITQPSLQRIESAGRLLDQYAVARALTNGQPILDPALQAVLSRVGQVTPLVAGQRIELSDGVALEALSPASPPGVTARAADEALALRLTYGDVSVVLPGDLSAQAQATLLNSGGVQPATVLQLPAGGAEDTLNPEWLALLQPSVAIAQTRAEDPNQPAPETRELLGDIPLFTTGERGPIHVWTDGQGVWVS